MKKILAMFCSLALFCGMFLGISAETKAAEPAGGESVRLQSGTWTGENDIVFGVNPQGGTVEVMNTVEYLKDDVSLGKVEVISSSTIIQEEGTFVISNDKLKNATTSEGKNIDWSEVDKLRISVREFVSGGGGSFFEVEVPVKFKVQSTMTVEPKEWTGTSDIVIKIDPKGEEVTADIEAMSLHDTATKQLCEVRTKFYKSIDKNGIITFTIKNDDLKNATNEKGTTVDWSLGGELHIIGDSTIAGEKASWVVMIPNKYKETETPESPETSKPTLTSGTWTGNADIVIKLPEGATEASLVEVYGIIGDSAEVGPKLEASVEGNQIVIKNQVLKNAVDPMNNGKPMDWTKITKLEVVVSYTLEGVSKSNSIYVPVSYKETTPSETTTLKDNSGVSMKLPATAPEGLSLKVGTSNGKAEKAAVAKLVDIDGDKIKTFDLSLMKDGVVWEYDGQFKSTITLPVPEGWNLDLLGLYYFDEATGKATAVPFTVDKENGTISFETNHFSRYVLVQKEAEETAPVTTKSPKTGDEANVVLYTMMMLVAGVTIVASVRRKRA